MRVNKNDVLELFSWYLNECIVNVTLFSDTTKSVQYQNKKFRLDATELTEMQAILKQGINSESIKFDEKTTDTIEKLIYSIASDNQSNIFSFSLLKGGIISYFSIFEYYIISLGKVVGITKKNNESFTEYLKRLYKSLGFGGLSEILGLDILKRYKEFYLRRNLYVHNYGVINDEFVGNIREQQLDEVLLDFNSSPERYRIGAILHINESYFLNNSIGLDIIGISITLLYFKSKEEPLLFSEALQKLKNFFLNNGDYEIIYIKMYHILVNKLNLNKNHSFTLGYGIALVSICRKVNNKKGYLKMKNDNVNKYIKSIKLEGLSKVDLCLYYFILDDKDGFFGIIQKEILLSRKGKIIGDCLSYNILCDYFLENIVIIKKIVEEEAIEIELNHNTTLNHISKIKKIRKILTND